MTIRIPKVKNLLTARPEGMDYATYKRLRTEQNKMLHGWNQTVMEGGSPSTTTIRVGWRESASRRRSTPIPATSKS